VKDVNVICYCVQLILIPTDLLFSRQYQLAAIHTRLVFC